MIKMNGCILDANGNEILMTHVGLNKMCNVVEERFGVPNFIRIKDDVIRMYYGKFVLLYEEKRKTLLRKRGW